MFKKFLVALAALIAATAFAVVDANKASLAELDSVKGIGPAISTRISDERKKGEFKDWNDMNVRVKGVGDKNAAKFSEGARPSTVRPTSALRPKPRRRCRRKPLRRPKVPSKSRFGHQGDCREGRLGGQGGRRHRQERRQGSEGKRAQKKAEKAAAAASAASATKK
jgi:competence protein ComEA